MVYSQNMADREIPVPKYFFTWRRNRYFIFSWNPFACLGLPCVSWCCKNAAGTHLRVVYAIWINLRPNHLSPLSQAQAGISAWGHYWRAVLSSWRLSLTPANQGDWWFLISSFGHHNQWLFVMTRIMIVCSCLSLFTTMVNSKIAKGHLQIGLPGDSQKLSCIQHHKMYKFTILKSELYHI